VKVESGQVSSVDQGEDWGFWKYYRETDAHQVVIWKKGVLYKKSIRKNEITSWDRGTYWSPELEWYERRRRRNLRRRYVRDGQALAGLASWNLSKKREEDTKGSSGRRMVHEVRIKTRRDRNEKLGTLNRSRGFKRKRTYNQFQNPEERRVDVEKVSRTERTRESFFQSRLRAQTGVEKKRTKERTKPLGLDQKIVMRTTSGNLDGKIRSSLSSGKKAGWKKLYVWTSQLARFRYGQRRKRIEQGFKKMERKKGN
jgi:hypothetical protein